MALTNRFSRDTDPRTVSEAVKRDGYAIIEELMTPEELRALRDDLDPWIERTEFGTEEFWGRHTKRFGALLSKSKASQDLLLHPKILGVADEVLLEYAASYWVNYTGVMYLAPGERAQSLHRDTELWPINNPAPPLTLATMWAANDFTKENGATLLVPGSHLWEEGHEVKPAQIEPAEMPAGSVLLYTGNVIHAGGANQSNDVRFGVALHYVLGWLRQEETQLLTVSPDEARALPEQVRRLMGYSLGSSSLGMVDHRDPHEYLTGIKEDKPKELSTPELDRNEEKLKRLSVVAQSPRKRLRIDVEPND